MGNLAATTSRAASSYSETAEAVIAALGTDARSGLSEAEVRRRLERDGPNELQAEKSVSAWRKFLAQFTDVLVILLLIATAISAVLWWLEREAALPYEAIAILAVVLLNAIMGFIQEERAESAVVALRKMSADQVTVLRDGKRRQVPAAELVCGDILVVEEGDTIPADARLIQSTALQTGGSCANG